jgi:hypothetical protein
MSGRRPRGTANDENAGLLVSLTREQYVERSMERALALLRVGRIREAVASMMADMRKDPNCRVPHAVNAIGISAAAAGDAAAARAYIEGFALTSTRPGPPSGFFWPSDSAEAVVTSAAWGIPDTSRTGSAMRLLTHSRNDAIDHPLVNRRTLCTAAFLDFLEATDLRVY